MNEIRISNKEKRARLERLFRKALQRGIGNSFTGWSEGLRRSEFKRAWDFAVDAEDFLADQFQENELNHDEVDDAK